MNNPALKNKASTIGTTTLDLAEYASADKKKEFDLTLPLIPVGDTTNAPLSLSVGACDIFCLCCKFKTSGFSPYILIFDKGSFSANRSYF